MGGGEVITAVSVMVTHGDCQAGPEAGPSNYGHVSELLVCSAAGL